MQARIDSDEGDLGAVVGVREAVERLEEGSRGSSDHAGRDGGVGNVDDEDVDGRLRSANLQDGTSATKDEASRGKRNAPCTLSEPQTRRRSS